jgi:hypothetical protein
VTASYTTAPLRLFFVNKKARKRRVPGGQRTPVASGGDWLKLSREKRALRNNSDRRVMSSSFVFFSLTDCAVSGCLRSRFDSLNCGRDDMPFVRTRQQGISLFRRFEPSHGRTAASGQNFGRICRSVALLISLRRSFGHFPCRPQLCARS